MAKIEEAAKNLDLTKSEAYKHLTNANKKKLYDEDRRLFNTIYVLKESHKVI